MMILHLLEEQLEKLEQDILKKCNKLGKNFPNWYSKKEENTGSVR